MQINRHDYLKFCDRILELKNSLNFEKSSTKMFFWTNSNELQIEILLNSNIIIWREKGIEHFIKITDAILLEEKFIGKDLSYSQDKNSLQENELIELRKCLIISDNY